MATAVPLAAALTLAALAALVPASDRSEPGHGLHFHGRDVTAENWGAASALADASGRRISLTDQKGKVVLLAFGYTHCPDACPTTLARLAEVRRLLGPDARQVQVMFVTVDPERDTAQLLTHYVTAFDPTFIGLRGTEAETDALASAFHADYRIMHYQGEILVEHTVEIYLIDAEGRARVVLPHILTAAQIADDVRSVLAGSRTCWPWSS